jgi:hypothetical protein
MEVGLFIFHGTTDRTRVGSSMTASRAASKAFELEGRA